MKPTGRSGNCSRSAFFRKGTVILVGVLCASLILGLLLLPTTEATEPSGETAVAEESNAPAEPRNTTGSLVTQRTEPSAETTPAEETSSIETTSSTEAPASSENNNPSGSIVNPRTTPSEDTTSASDDSQENSTKGSLVTARTEAASEESTQEAASDETTQETTREPYATLEKGMKNDDVLKMQNALKNLGYPGFIADSDFGDNTELAVKFFQFYNGLPVTGEADDATLSKLYGSDAEKYKNLAKGSTGNAVQVVQEFLHEAGFLTDEPDGSYGPGTEGAVRVFQAAAGFEKPDGSVGKDTVAAMVGDPITFTTLKLNDNGAFVAALQKKLKELGFLTVNTSTSSDADKKSDVSGIYDADTEIAVKEFQMYAGLEITGEADADTCNKLFRNFVTFKNLQKGGKGTVVKTLQILLKELGYLSDEPDGSFGPATKKAVRDFQVVNDLRRDSSFGKNTADVLLSNPLPYDQEAIDNAGNDAEAFAKEILDEVGWDLYAAFEWSVGMKYVSYMNDGFNTTDSAIYSFMNHAGNCLGLATTFYWMARALGYTARCIVGSVPYRDTDEFGEHAWVEVDIDGVTYVCDPDYEMQVGKNGYMIRYGQSGTWEYRYGYILGD